MNNRSLVIIFVVMVFLVVIVYFEHSGEEKVITFAFDDGFLNVYENAYPLLDSYGYKGTVYVITSKIGDDFEGIRVMSLENLKELESKGWEIGSHTVNHYDLTSLHVGFIDYELLESKEQLQILGFEVHSLAIPYGKYDDTIKSIAQEYYSSVRPSSWGVNKLNNFDRYEIKSIWLTNTTDFNFVKEQIDSMSRGEWLVFMIHNVDYEDQGTYNISPDLLSEIIMYINNKNIDVKTISEVVSEYGRI